MSFGEEFGCTCESWSEYIGLIDTALTLAQTHTHSAWPKIEYPSGGIFKFCPWCGEALDASQEPGQKTIEQAFKDLEDFLNEIAEGVCLY